MMLNNNEIYDLLCKKYAYGMIMWIYTIEEE